jgi:hypothetical protein
LNLLPGEAIADLRCRSYYSIEGPMKRLLVFLLFSSVFVAQRKQGNPLDSPSPNMELLTHFGERSDFSPDNVGYGIVPYRF